MSNIVDELKRLVAEQNGGDLPAELWGDCNAVEVLQHLTAAGGGGGAPLVKDLEGDYLDAEELVHAIETRADVWVVDAGRVMRITGFTWVNNCGPYYWIQGTYLSLENGTVTPSKVLLSTTADEALIDRLDAISPRG